MEKFLNKLLVIAFLLFLILLGILIYFFYFKTTPLKNLKIQIQGPAEVSSLEPVKYRILITNETQTKMTDTSLKINLSSGGFFQDQTQEKSIFLGDIGPQQSAQQDIEIYFLNEGGLKEEIRVSFYYKIETKPNVFEKSENLSILVKNPPIKAQILVPTKIYVNQQFQTTFNIVNLTSQKLNDIQIAVEVPENFLLVSSFPQSSNFYWNLGSLEANETKTISLVGQIQNALSSGVFSAKINFSFQGKQFSLPKEFAKVNILENPVAFQIKTLPQQESIPIGSRINYEILIENKSQTTLENNEIKVSLIGPFDFFSLYADGYSNQIEKSVSWNPRNKSELAVFKPGDQIKINFSVSLFQSYPILSDANKNFVATMRIEFKTPTIPAEIENPESKEYVVYQEVNKKIIGKIQIEHWLAYERKYPISQGPFPLEPNKKTTLNWHINIKTLGEDFQDFSLFTKFPPGVNLTNKIAGDALKENIQFDKATGNFWYSIKNLPANLGYTQKNLELIFQLEIEPPAYSYLNSWIIIPQPQYSAKGTFSQADLTGQLNNIYTSMIKQE